MPTKRALQIIEAPPFPAVVLLEWGVGDEARLTRFCEALRRVARPGLVHIVGLLGLGESGPSGVVESVVHDLWRRPFGDEALLRVRQAVRHMRAVTPPTSPRAALDEALASESGGEVVVRSGSVLGHIHVQGGQIAWAHISSAPATLAAVVRYAGVELEPETVAAVTDECRATRSHFVDVLVRWRVLPLAGAKEALRAFVSERVRMVLEVPNATALFLPKTRAHAEHLRFSVEELPALETPRVASARPPSIAPPPMRPSASLPVSQLEALLREAVAIEGVVAAAVLDRTSGASVLMHGAALDEAIAWAQLSLLAALGADGEDVIAAAGDRGFLMRALPFCPTAALFVVLQQSATTLGLARSLVARIVHATAAAGAARAVDPTLNS